MLDFFDALATTPFSLRASVCAAVVGATLLLHGALHGSPDGFSGRDIFFPAVVISALLCGVAGGFAAVALFLLVHFGLLGLSLERPAAPAHLATIFNFLFDSTAYIALARLPSILARARRAKDALVHAEAEQLRQFVEQTPAGMAMLDTDLTYLATSARWRETLELGSDVRGRAHYEVHPDLPEQWKVAHRRALAGETVRCDQDVVPQPDGRERWVRWEVRPWRLSDGQIGGIIIFGEDITEQVQMQQELRDKEKRLNAIFDTAMDAIVSIDRGGLIRSVNPAAQDIFHYTADELLGRNVEMLMPEPFASHHADAIAAYVQTGVKKIIGQRRVVAGLRKTGEVFPLELTVSEASVDNAFLFVGVMRDLSPIEEERRRVSLLRDELAHVSRLNDMGEMVAGLAHEVSQPVAAILNFAAAYRRALATSGKPPEADLIGKIEVQARRATEILKRLRGFIEKRPPERRAVEIETLIDDALKLVSLRTGARLVHIEPPPELAGACVRADPIQIEQVLLNLLRNADDALAATEAPEIIVETSAVGTDRIRLSVADNGVGVEPDAIVELFDPFFTTKHRGMGVGLSICKGIIESHGGAIAYRPNAPQGSIFEFELPISPCASAAGAPAREGLSEVS